MTQKECYSTHRFRDLGAYDHIVEMSLGLLVSDKNFFVCTQIPVIAELQFSTCGCKTFTLDALGDHERVKQVARSRGQ